MKATALWLLAAALACTRRLLAPALADSAASCSNVAEALDDFNAEYDADWEAAAGACGQSTDCDYIDTDEAFLAFDCVASCCLTTEESGATFCIKACDPGAPISYTSIERDWERTDASPSPSTGTGTGTSPSASTVTSGARSSSGNSASAPSASAFAPVSAALPFMGSAVFALFIGATLLLVAA